MRRSWAPCTPPALGSRLGCAECRWAGRALLTQKVFELQGVRQEPVPEVPEQEYVQRLRLEGPRMLRPQVQHCGLRAGCVRVICESQTLLCMRQQTAEPEEVTVSCLHPSVAGGRASGKIRVESACNWRAPDFKLQRY
jgi:hypothetical protein